MEQEMTDLRLKSIANQTKLCEMAGINPSVVRSIEIGGQAGDVTIVRVEIMLEKVQEIGLCAEHPKPARNGEHGG